MARKAAKPKPIAPEKPSWIVRVRCTVIMEYVCENCSEDQARADPFEHSTDETETDMPDWEVLDVKRND